ncbi:MAG: hypothetical protein GY757_48665 [bacterium]|nr:hypothetical protein [bacterium]
MDRKEFLAKTLKMGLCCSGALVASSNLNLPLMSASTEEKVSQEKQFIENWLTDLLTAIDSQLDEKTKISLIDACGKGCFNRHKWKSDIAAKSKGDLDKLISVMKKNFECWKEGNKVHVRFGKISTICYCPVLKNAPKNLKELHCNCTKATQQAIFETALNRKLKVDIVETLRRGGKTCHFIVHV